MIDLKPAYTLTIDQLATLFNRAFTGYIGGDVHFTAEALARFLARDNIDLDLSQIVVRDEQPVGFGYVSRQGWASRLAAFGIVPEASGAGIGTATMRQMIEQAKQRGDRVFELEVIEQNTRAVKLYEGVGFERVRRLVGYELKSPLTDARAERAASKLQTMNVYEVGRVIMQYGTPDLPWQVSGATIARAAPPNVGYALDGAYAAITNPDAEVVALRALIVPPELRRQGRATRLMRAIFARHPGKRWVLSAITPEDIGGDFLASLGFERTVLTQFQMRLGL